MFYLALIVITKLSSDVGCHANDLLMKTYMKIYRAPKSHEILMFVCLQKDAKQCCDAAKLACAHCAVVV